MSRKPKVLVAITLYEDAMKRLREVADVDVVDEDSIQTKEGLLKVIGNYEGVIVALPPIDEEVLKKARRLKIISRHGVGYDSVDVKAATDRGIYVTITPGNSVAVAEIAFALMLAAARKIPQAHFYVKNRQWRQGADRSGFVGVEFSGKTLGILGLGRIGSITARIGKGFNMRLLYNDVIRYGKLEGDLPIGYRSLNQLLAEADFISVHVPLNKETRGLIGEKELRIMKKDAIIVNTARGPIIDEKDLYKALKEKWIAAAGLDVFEEEPTSLNNPLLNLDNVISTPHIAASTKESRYRCAMMAVENVIQVLQGEKPPYPVA